MRTKNNEGIQAVLMHTVNGVQYRVNGTIVAINEANQTCSMKFKGYDVLHNIPVSKVYLDEGILDKFKEVGSKLADAGSRVIAGIKRLVKAFGGFILPLINGAIEKTAINAPINVAIYARSEAMAETGFYIMPSMSLMANAEAMGVKLANDDIADVVGEQETNMIETYWSRVMKTYAKNESMQLKDAVRHVNETYYKVNATYKALNESGAFGDYNKYKKKRLNEAVVSLKAPKNDDGSVTQYGPNVDTKELKARLDSNIRQQISGTCMDHASAHPLLIFGAPGIGKTSIVKQIFGDWRKARAAYNKLQDEWIDNPASRAENEDIVDQGLDLTIEYQICSSLQKDDFVIPGFIDYDVAGTQQRAAKAIPKVWFPVFTPINNDKNDQANIDLDEFYNSGAHKPGSSGTNDGGVIFFDEFFRMTQEVSNIAMNIINDHIYEGMYLASRWGFVLASNRATEMYKDEGEYEGRDATVQEDAKKTRYIPVNFVPTRREWLEWATQKNSRTGRKNVDKTFTDFIETMGDEVWYDALDFGSRSNIKPSSLSKLTVSQVNDVVSSDEYAQDQNSLTWNPRVWETTINNAVWDEVRFKLFKEQPTKFDRMYNTLIKSTVDDDLPNETRVAHIDNRRWNQFVNDPSNKRVWAKYDNLDDRMSYVTAWLNWYNEYKIYNSSLFNEIIDENGDVDYGLLGDALDRISDNDWDQWLNSYVDGMYHLDGLDPKADAYKDAMYEIKNSDRLHIFQKWMSYYIGQTVGAESTVMHKWNNFNNYVKTFNTQNIRSIWRTGKMIGKYADDDALDFTRESEYDENTEFSKWKSNSIISRSAIDLLFKGYPFGQAELSGKMSEADKVTTELAARNKQFDPRQDAPLYLMDDKEYDELWHKYAEKYSDTIHGKKVYFLFSPVAKVTKKMKFNYIPAEAATTKDIRESRQAQMNLIYMLQNSQFAEEFANVSYYIARVDLQRNNHMNLGRVNSLIAFKWLKNYYKDFGKKLAALCTAGTDNEGNEQYEAQSDLLASQQLVTYPALCINCNAKKL